MNRDQALFGLIREQGGVVRRDQLEVLGFPTRTIARRVASGMLTPAGRSVLVAAGPPDDLLHRSLVVAHRTWPRGVLTGPSAVVLHQRQAEPPWDCLDLGLRPWVVHHNALDGARVLRRGGRVPSQTVLGVQVADLGTALSHMLECLPLDEAKALAFRSAQIGGSVQLAMVIERARPERRHGKGAAQLRFLLHSISSGAHSEAETLAVDLLREHGVTGFRVNHPVRIGGRRRVLDIAFPEQMLAIEIDGQAWHTSPKAFSSDRSRQNSIILGGWRLLRFTWADLVERPDYVVQQVVAALG